MTSPCIEPVKESDGVPFWQKVVFAGDCLECENCGEEFCDQCMTHYAECSCPGPSQDEDFEYREDADGVMWAKALPDQ